MHQYSVYTGNYTPKRGNGFYLSICFILSSFNFGENIGDLYKLAEEAAYHEGGDERGWGGGEHGGNDAGRRIGRQAVPDKS